MENIKLEIDESKVVPCPEKYKSNKNIGSIPKSSKRVFNSIMDYCEFKKIDKIEFMQPHQEEWKKHFKKLNDGIMTYQDFEFLQTSILLKKINFDYEHKKITNESKRRKSD